MKMQILLVFLMVFLGVLHSNGQNVGIGTTDPQANLEIRDGQSSELRLGLSNTNWAKFQYSSNEGLRIEAVNAGIEFTPALLIGKELKFYSGAGTTPERMRIASDGRVGIGTTSPTDQLDVVGGIRATGNNANLSLQRTSGPNYINFNNSQPLHLRSIAPDGGNDNIRMTLDANGTTVQRILKVKHTSSAGEGLIIQDDAVGDKLWRMRQWFDPNVANLLLYTDQGHVGTFSYISGAYTHISDRNLKTDIKPMPEILANIMKLEPKTYVYKKDEKRKRQLGFIAQDVESVFPELVAPGQSKGDSNTNYTMDYSGFGVLAIKAIQEQQLQIAALQAQNETLVKDKQQMARSIAKLEAAVFGTASVDGQSK